MSGLDVVIVVCSWLLFVWVLRDPYYAGPTFRSQIAVVFVSRHGALTVFYDSARQARAGVRWHRLAGFRVGYVGHRRWFA